jgi:hypothetical protein
MKFSFLISRFVFTHWYNLYFKCSQYFDYYTFITLDAFLSHTSNNYSIYKNKIYYLLFIILFTIYIYIIILLYIYNNYCYIIIYSINLNLNDLLTTFHILIMDLKLLLIQCHILMDNMHY